jgi:hypothetical protein
MTTTHTRLSRAARGLLALVLLLSAPAALATCTWSSTGNSSAKIVCTSGNESAPTLATEGLSLTAGGIALKGLGLTAEADTGQTFTATPSGTLQAYLYDDVAAAWVRVPDLDVSVTATSLRRQGWQGFTVLAARGRIAFVPVSVTLSSGGITLYLNGSR